MGRRRLRSFARRRCLRRRIRTRLAAFASPFCCESFRSSVKRPRTIDSTRKEQRKVISEDSGQRGFGVLEAVKTSLAVRHAVSERVLRRLPMLKLDPSSISLRRRSSALTLDGRVRHRSSSCLGCCLPVPEFVLRSISLSHNLGDEKMGCSPEEDA